MSEHETVYSRAVLIDRADEGGTRRYRFRASSSAAARDGMIIPAGEWRTDNYLRNPVILLSHDYWTLPIGRTVELIPDEDGLVAVVEYDPEDPRAVDVMRKLDGGFLHAVSVGFRPGRVEWPAERSQPGYYRDVELLEISNVSVPSDPNALQLHGLRLAIPDDLSTRLAALVERIEAVERRMSPPPAEAERDVTEGDDDVVLTVDLDSLRRFTCPQL